MFIYSPNIGRGRKPTSGTGGEDPGGGSGGATGLYPKSFSDPMFTGMSEQPSSVILNLTNGQTLNKYSWTNDTTPDWSVKMANNNTLNTCRIQTREGPRFAGATNAVFNYLYLESFGTDPEDHADGFQWEGGNNSATFTHCHFRTENQGFTCGFAADGSTGSISFEDCIWTCAPGGGNGLVMYADAGAGTIQVSMKNCYIQETGWGNQNIFINRNDGTTFPCGVTLWDNVRYCDWDHATGTLTPGALVPQPSGT